MAIDDALVMLASDYWDSVWSALSADDRDRLYGAVGALVSAEPDEQEFNRAVIGLLQLLRELLPEDHEVLDAADATYRYVAAPPVDWRPAVSGLGARIAVIASEDVHQWLSRRPALSIEQVRSAGSDPGQPFLIRLDAAGGGFRFPAFQFDPAGRPIETVLAINALLGADDDPWGVADWWLGDNAWLDAVPAELIGSRDDVLLAAAAAARRPDWW
jgi:hypothetical protein